MSYLPFATWVWFVGACLVLGFTGDIGATIAWPIIAVIKAARAVLNAVKAA